MAPATRSSKAVPRSFEFVVIQGQEITRFTSLEEVQEVKTYFITFEPHVHMRHFKLGFNLPLHYDVQWSRIGSNRSKFWKLL